jgi:hypothetical protein
VIGYPITTFSGIYFKGIFGLLVAATFLQNCMPFTQLPQYTKMASSVSIKHTQKIETNEKHQNFSFLVILVECTFSKYQALFPNLSTVYFIATLS